VRSRLPERDQRDEHRENEQGVRESGERVRM
jgi:hypothetical protein